MKHILTILRPKNIFTVTSVVLLLTVFTASLWAFVTPANAATGINGEINFQGKLVDNNGLNVADGTYTVVFTLYDAASSGTNLWTETDSVTTTAGIFQVSLGAVNTALPSVNFNSDSIYMGIKVGTDAEMTPRIRFTAVPYAFNAQRVNGLTVTNTSGNSFTGTTTLQIGDGKTVAINNGLTFSGTDGTNITFQGTDTYVGRGTTDTLTNKTIGATGLTFSGASTDLLTGTNEDLTITANGSGDVVLTSDADTGVAIGSASNTAAPLSISGGIGSNASLIVNQLNSGDLFAASQSGATKFVIENDGTIDLASANYTNCGTLGTNSSASVTCGPAAVGGSGDQVLAVYAISTAAGSNLHVVFNGAVDSAPASASGTITFPANTSKLMVEAKAAGGGGGGTSTATAIKNAGGGGEGGYSSKFITSVGSNYYIKVGGGGAGGTNGANGGTGTSTCFGTNAADACNSALIDAIGGSGGVGINAAGVAAGGNGGTSSGGDINLNGQPGFNSSAVALASWGGAGGGIAGAPAVTVAGNGTAGSNGGGGSGAGGIASSGTARNGGAGGAGYVLIYVYKSANTGATGADGWYQYASGVLAPVNLTSDVLIGGNSTASADFGFLNVNSGTPTASISAGLTGALTLSATGVIGTTNNQTLELGSAGTGNLAFAPGGSTAFTAFSNGRIGIGTAAPLATLDVRGNVGTAPVASVAGVTSFAAMVVNNSGVGDIFAASKSGATKFVITNSGNVGIGTANPTATLQVAGNALFQNVSNSTFAFQILNNVGSAAFNVDTVNDRIGIGTSAPLTALDVRGTFSGTLPSASISAQSSAASLVVDNAGLGDIFTASKSGASKFTILNNGNVEVNNLSNCPAIVTNAQGILACGSFGATQNFWQLNNGAVSPFSSGADLLIGGTSTASADFAFINANSGTPTASISANLGGAATFLTGTGILSTTNAQSLVLGSASTGDISLDPGAVTALTAFSNGRIGIGIGGNPLATLDVRGNSGTVPAASISAQSSFASLVVNNSGVGDLFAASKSGATKFVVTNNGNVGIGVTSPTALLQVGAFSSSVTPGYVFNGIASSNISGNAAYVGNWQSGNLWGIGSATNVNGDNSLRLGTTASNNTNVWNPTQSMRLALNGTLGTSAQAALDVQAATGTLPVASIAGATTNAALIVDNSGLGDLFAASKSGATKFVVNNAGDVGIGVSNPTHALDVFNGGILQLNGGQIQDYNDLAFKMDADNNGANVTKFLNGAGTQIMTLTETGQLGINTGISIPFAALDVRGQSATTPVASLSGQTSFAALVVNNSGTGDLMTASNGGKTKFVINNSGSALFQGDTISSSTSATLTNNGSGAVVDALGDQGSMIPNAGFEANTSNSRLADGWVVSATTSAAVTRDTAIEAKGSASARVTLNNATAAFYSACIPLTGVINNVYTLNYYAKSNASAPTVRAYIDGFATKTDCQNNKLVQAPTPVATTAITTSWAKYGSGTTAVPDTSFGATTTWGRVHFYVATASNTFINIDGVRLVEVDSGQGLDYAEDYPTDPANMPQPGDVVRLQAVGNASVIVPANTYMDTSVIGVISTNPGYVLDDGSMDENKAPVALAGRIPTHVSTKNGAIHIGDYLTSSDIPGVAVKAISAGSVIGQAMEEYTEPDPAKIGSVVMFLKNTYYNGMPLTLNSGLTQDNSQGDLAFLGTLVDQSQKTASASSALTSISADKVTAGLELITPKVIADTVQVNTIKASTGQDVSVQLSDNGVFSIKNASGEARVTFDTSGNGYLAGSLSTDTIKSASNTDVSVQLSDNGTFVIKNASGEAKVAFDPLGNAYFAGTITADKINANQIEGLDVLQDGTKSLEARVKTLEDIYASSSALMAIQPAAASPAALPIADQVYITSLQSVQDATVSGSLRVQGNGLIEGVLHVVDTLTAENLIVNQVADFFSNVIFHGDVLFKGTPTFNRDTAGYVTIPKGSDNTSVNFKSEYKTQPVINASIVTQVMTDDLFKKLQTDGICSSDQDKSTCEDTYTKAIVSEGAQFVIAKRSTKGFIIVLNNKTPEDMTFSWTALSVSDDEEASTTKGSENP